MGLIVRQTLKSSIYSYLGIALGFLNVAILMPKLFSTNEIGLVNLLIAMSSIIGQFGTLGLTNITIRLFPYFRDKQKKHNGFLFVAMTISTLGFMLCMIFYYFAKPMLIADNIEKSSLFVDYVYLLVPLIFFTIYLLLFDTYNRTLFNASFGIFVKEFLLRVLNLIGIVLFALKIFDFNDFIIYYTLSYGVPVLLIFLLLIYKKEFSLKPSFSFLNKKIVKEIISVGLYGIIAGFSGIAIFQIDKYLVNYYCDLNSTGIYSTLFFFGSVVLAPGRALSRISSSVISEALKTNDIQKVSIIYKKSTTNLLFSGFYLFIIIWINVGNMLNYLPDNFKDSGAYYVLFFILIAHLFQNIATTAADIIQYSKYYRSYTVFTLILLILIVLFNVLLIPKYGIIGAAIACSMAFMFNLIIRLSYVKLKLKLNCFQLKHLMILLLTILLCVINYLIPNYKNIFIDILFRTTIFSVLYILPLYLLNYSPEFNAIIKGIISKIKNRLRSK